MISAAELVLLVAGLGCVLALGYEGYEEDYGSVSGAMSNRNGVLQSGIEQSPAEYRFQYGVADPYTGDFHQQQEVREGDVVKGSYSLKEPDGSTRIVEYISTPYTGFRAVVRKIGPSVHPLPYPYYLKEPVLEGDVGLEGGYEEPYVPVEEIHYE